MTLTYLSVCSGIEAASVAWHTLGWRPVAFSEIDPFACAMLAARFPLVPNLGDMERYREWPIEPGAIDVLVGGSPCQSFSVAGLRKGLDDPRGNLALVYLGLVDRFRPRWIVWENVPGVLSSSGGRDFGAFLGGLAQLGYGFAWRVLDAQYTRVDSHPRAVPQRRRRVFVVGCARGDWRRAASVLLEREGVHGNPPTRGQAWQGTPRGPAAGAPGGSGAGVGHAVAPCIGASGRGFARTGETQGQDAVVAVADVSPTVARALTTSCQRLDSETETLIPFDTSPANRSQPQPGDPCRPLAREGHAPAVAWGISSDAIDRSGEGDGSAAQRAGLGITEECSPSLRARHAQVVAFNTKESGRDATFELCPPLRAESGDPHMGGRAAVAYSIRGDAMRDGGQAVMQGGEVFDGVSPTMRIGTQSEKGGGNPPAVFTLEVWGREGERVLEYRTDGTANALRTSTGGRDGLGVGAISFYPNMGANARSDGAREGVAGTLAGADGGNRPAVAFNTYQRTDGGEVFDTLGTNMLRADQGVREVGASMAVRRLTPRECERLQGFPDDWTAITYRGKPASDGPRYKALGNSMATNVMRWIGLRIAAVEGGTHEVR